MKEVFKVGDLTFRDKIEFFIREKIKKETIGLEPVFMYVAEQLPRFHCPIKVTNKKYLIGTKEKSVFFNRSLGEKHYMLSGKSLDNLFYDERTHSLVRKGAVKFPQGTKFNYNGGFLEEYYYLVEVELDLGNGFVICKVNESSTALYSYRELESMNVNEDLVS